MKERITQKMILQEIYYNELELYSFIRDTIETYETAEDKEDLCRLIILSRHEFMEQKERSGKTLDLIRGLLEGVSK